MRDIVKAITYETYGPPDILRLRDIDTPVPGDGDVLVSVHSASVNKADWHRVTGTPYLVRLVGGLRRPKRNIPGTDVAGSVEAVGKNVQGLLPGDEVFGWQSGGCFAEFVCVPCNQLVPKPSNISFDEASTMGVAAFTALQGLRDKGKIQPRHKVLINGASGDVGTFAVQIAKSLGAHVTAVCSPDNLENAHLMGADEVIDYTREDFVQSRQSYDLLLDIAGNRSLTDCRRVLKEAGKRVLVGGPVGLWLGPLPHMMKALLLSILSQKKFIQFIAQETKEDLIFLSQLLERGELAPVIDRRYPLKDAAKALAYQGEGHAKGKIVVTVSGHTDVTS
jgi:NADPH:quinone reductase-like Zn-dependent oxidoreductase